MAIAVSLRRERKEREFDQTHARTDTIYPRRIIARFSNDEIARA